MDAYIYCADIYCDTCGEAIRNDLAGNGNAPVHPRDECAYDSDAFPKGPYSDGGGEADAPQHCGACGEFLENPLTQDGARYVLAALLDHANCGRGDPGTLSTWLDFYQDEILDALRPSEKSGA